MSIPNVSEAPDGLEPELNVRENKGDRDNENEEIDNENEENSGSDDCPSGPPWSSAGSSSVERSSLIRERYLRRFKDIPKGVTLAETDPLEFIPRRRPFRRMKTWGGIMFHEECGIDRGEWKGLLQIPTSDRPGQRIKKRTASMPSVTGSSSSLQATGRSTRGRGLGIGKNPRKKTASRAAVSDQPASASRKNPPRRKRTKR